VYKAKNPGQLDGRMAYPDFLVGARELYDHLEDPQWHVVDCRFELTRPDKGFSDYLAGHVPGAVYAHLDRDLAAPVSAATGRHPLPEPETFARTLGRFGIAPQARVVVYDQGGGAIAARLWWMLRWMGHRSVRLLDGGFDTWRREGLPLETQVPDIEPLIYAGQADERMIVTTREVAEALEAGSPLPLVDARDPARFEGKSEPIDPVAGHIPAARNFPFGDSLTPEGVWRPGAELRQLWSRVLGEPVTGASGGDRGPLTAMCGSGVTACHLVLSAGLAGLPLPRLYVGSWSEWIRDPARPVATGPQPGAGGY
jgi:thiosulfate/3-mercaptopyruvate sulfurtransferase